MGFLCLMSDSCAYIRWQGNGFQIITVWVDDLLIFSTSEVGMCLTKTQIVSTWQTTDLGKPSKIIGIQITHGYNSISISQKQYIEYILRKEGMEFANPVATPLDHAVKIAPNKIQSDSNCSNPFACLLCKLQYVVNATRLDISFAVNRLVLYTANPSQDHYVMLKRILRYLASTKDYGITYCKWTHNPQLIGYSDAAHANANESKSMTEIVFILGGGGVLWKSKKQTINALSSTEAEYDTLSHTRTEVQWFWNLLTELGFPQNEPVIIQSDNLRAIARANDPYLTTSS
jgi:hypothetical protein